MCGTRRRRGKCTGVCSLDENTFNPSAANRTNASAAKKSNPLASKGSNSSAAPRTKRSATQENAASAPTKRSAAAAAKGGSEPTKKKRQRGVRREDEQRPNATTAPPPPNVNSANFEAKFNEYIDMVQALAEEHVPSDDDDHVPPSEILKDTAFRNQSLLLDYEEGTLTMFKNDIKLGVIKEGISGAYSWMVTVGDWFHESSSASDGIKIERGPPPAGDETAIEPRVKKSRTN